MELKRFFSKLLKNRKKKLSEKDLAFSKKITKITGVEINNIEFYKEAFSLKNSSERKGKNYERLEFLGDAILGSIISWYLYETYPNANEGYLTQMKAKIVNRKNLNRLGEDLKFQNFIQKGKSGLLGENTFGNIFEAFIGAIYLDLGYENCKNIVLKKIFTPDEIIKLENKVMSYKGLLLEWSQKKKCILRYETSAEPTQDKTISFRSIVWIDDKKISNASDSSKKKAEEKAAQRAFYILNKKENIIEKQNSTS